MDTWNKDLKAKISDWELLQANKIASYRKKTIDATKYSSGIAFVAATGFGLYTSDPLKAVMGSVVAFASGYLSLHFHMIRKRFFDNNKNLIKNIVIEKRKKNKER